MTSTYSDRRQTHRREQEEAFTSARHLCSARHGTRRESCSTECAELFLTFHPPSLGQAASTPRLHGLHGKQELQNICNVEISQEEEVDLEDCNA